MQMKVAGVYLLLMSVTFMIWGIVAEVFADYDYSNQIGSYWNLADKASSLDVKSDYLDKFVEAVNKAGLSGNNAIFLKTPDNSVEQNLNALHSLQIRMHEIKGMDVTSFAYQQAIQQITAQEQGEAHNLLSVIEGAWFLKNHPLLWDWVDAIKWFALIAASIISAFMIWAD